MSTIVIMPGGFHPFHAGHYSLYNDAKKTFPGAEVYVAATNDMSERPFPFSLKEKLAKLAGVDAGHFVQVKSPFQAKEITQNYNPEQDVLIFVRSEKDRNESPKPGGTKKDGTPAYFQPWTGKNVQPFAKHAYFAYLPTVEFGPGITSATQIRNAWPTLDDRRKTAMVMSLYPATQKNPKLAQTVVGMFDQVMGGQEGVTEGYSNTTFNVDRRKLNVPTLIQKGAILVTYPHGEQGWETDNKEDWAFSLLSLYNVLQGGWASEAKKYLKPESYKRAEQQINSSAPNLGSDKLVYDGKYNQILWSIKKLGIPDNVAFLDKDKQGVAEGAPIVVAQAPIDIRNPKKAPQPYRNQGDIVPPTQPPSTEKRGVKGRPGQRPMPTYESANLSVEQLAHISDKALDDAYHYGRSTPGANFGWMANLQSAKAAKKLIDAGETDIETISDAIHKGWNITAAADYKGQLQLDTPTPEDKKLKRAKLAMQSYSQLPEEEKEKDRVVARAMLAALGKTNVSESADYLEEK